MALVPLCSGCSLMLPRFSSVAESESVPPFAICGMPWEDMCRDDTTHEMMMPLGNREDIVCRDRFADIVGQPQRAFGSR